MEPLDWGDGDYARTAARLAPAAEVVLDAAGVRPGHRVLDMACGTGNAALAAAARGATVTGVDLSERLVALASARADAAGLSAACTFLAGDALDPPVGRAAFDVAVSVFGVIFVPDAEAALRRMRDALVPGGTLAVASWSAAGPVHVAGSALRAALPAREGPDPTRWDDPSWVAARVAGAGLREVSQTEAEVVWSAPSPEEWFAEHEEHHPVWRWARRALPEARWAAVRDESVAALRAGSDDPDAFRAPGRYLVTRAVR